MTRVYDFRQQLNIGETGEAAIDRLLAERLQARSLAVSDLQRAGVDRVLTVAGQYLLAEYKTDHKAAETGNAFIETTSVSSSNKQGWALTCQADALVYAVPRGPRSSGRVYWLSPRAIRERLGEWLVKYPTGQCQNREYHSEGILVPLHELEVLALTTFDFPPEQTAANKD